MKHTVIESSLREGFLRFPTPSIFTALLVLATFLVFLTLPAIAPAQSSSKPDLSQAAHALRGWLRPLSTREWRWEYPKVINEYLRNTLQDNFKLIDKYPHYIFKLQRGQPISSDEGVLPRRL